MKGKDMNYHDINRIESEIERDEAQSEKFNSWVKGNHFQYPAKDMGKNRGKNERNKGD